MPEIKITKNKANKNEHALLIYSKPAELEKSGYFSKNELAYLEQKGNGSSLISINQYSRMIWVAKMPKEKGNAQKEGLRVIGNKLYKGLKEEKADTVTLHQLGSPKGSTLMVLEGILLSDYCFDKYKSVEKPCFEMKRISICDKVTQKAIDEMVSLCGATTIARDLVNEPVCTLSAERYSERVKELGEEHGFSVEVFNKAKIESLQMGALLAVNKGAEFPPTFTIMEHKPKKAINSKPIVLVGKGVMYDTGGANIKVGDFMTDMKADMGGAAAVTGAMVAIASQKLPVHVIGLVPATENRINGKEYVPGDIVKTYSGKTIEVLNTDAEGRIILSDALGFATKYKPELVIDLATLTGAAVRAIGSFATVMMGNASEEKRAALSAAGDEVHERLAEMPFWDDYKEELKSDIADIKNLGGPYAGQITAGKFLEFFTNYPYIHLDVAGTAFIAGASAYRPKGGTGTGVRLLYQFIKNYAAN